MTTPTILNTHTHTHLQVALTIQWDTQHDSPNQSTFCAVPYTRLTRRAYVTTPAAVRERFLPLWRGLLVALRKVRAVRLQRHACYIFSLPDLAMLPFYLLTVYPNIKATNLHSTYAATYLHNHTAPACNPQANVTSEGADTVALGDTFVGLWRYFQAHDWDFTWADPQVSVCVCIYVCSCVCLHQSYLVQLCKTNEYNSCQGCSLQRQPPCVITISQAL